MAWQGKPFLKKKNYDLCFGLLGNFHENNDQKLYLKNDKVCCYTHEHVGFLITLEGFDSFQELISFLCYSWFIGLR